MIKLPATHDTDGHCTLAGATGSATLDGAPLIGGTSDNPFTTRTRLLVSHPAQGAKFIATQIQSSTPQAEAIFEGMYTRGVNSYGFAYTWSSAEPDPQHEPTFDMASGTTFKEFGELLLTQATSVNDAVDMLESNARAIHGNFLLTDSSGSIGLVEVSTRSIHLETLMVNGAVGRTNHWISPRMSRISPIPDPLGSSAIRLQRITDLMANGDGKIDINYLWKCFSDHATLDTTGWSICAHGIHRGSADSGGGTISSEIMDPVNQVLYYCYGWPCGTSSVDASWQHLQERSWGEYIGFKLNDLVPGEYVTSDGRLCPTAVRYINQRT